VVSASGGKLLELAREKKLPYFELPGDIQPRMAVLYAVRAMVTLIERMGLVKGALEELVASGEWLAGQMKWGADVATTENEAKQIAGELVGHPAVVYAGAVLGFAAMKWKIAFNENAKNIAFYNYFPELNHNEFIGWGHPERSGLKVIELRSDLDRERVQKRFDVTNRLRSDVFAPIEVRAEGKTPLEQLVWTIALGEYAATYLAILNQVDPTPVDLVERFKKELG
jgi:glucose/mannose-6-phosphate isomerase